MPRGFRRFADPVHGTIPVREDAADLIDTESFQRLRHVLQLGLAHYAFPGANYSRFSHSLGVHHVLNLSCDSLRSVSASQRQLFSLAGLLHDIGHYPFSHAMEDALKEFFAQQLVVDEQEDDPSPESPPSHLTHVAVGREILLNDDQVASRLPKNLHPEVVADAFSRRLDDPLVNLVSSDLDADRIDFLLRAAHHSGLPYGRVDLDYLLDHLTFDKHRRLALHTKALRTADHMLLCRFFDYQQVVFQKTVAGLEEVLKTVLIDLVRLGRVPSSATEVQAMIADGRWRRFDDVAVMNCIREFALDESDSVMRDRATSIVKRIPPRVAFERDFMARRREGAVRYTELRRQLEELKPVLADRTGVPEGLWWVWGKRAELTSGEPIPADEEDLAGWMEPAEYAKAVRILQPNKESVAIMDHEASLMGALGAQQLFALKVFVLIPESRSGEKDRILKLARRVLTS